MGHNDTIVIHDLPGGTTYTVTEADNDYKTTVRVNTGTASNTKTNNGTLTEDTTVAFTNIRDGLVPTRANTPFMTGFYTLLAGAWLAFYLWTKRRKEEKERMESSLLERS